MMKVPTYTSQAQLSGKSGGIQFNVKASPEGFSQSARAQTSLFATMEKAATGFLEAETKAQRQSQLIEAQNTWNAQNQTDTMDLNKMSSGQILGTYSTRQTNNTKNVSTGITDKVVRKRFDEWANTARTDSDAAVNKIYRSKWVDEGLVTYNAKIDQLERDLITGTKVQQAKARLELYGDAATNKTGIYAEMAQLGFLSMVDAQKGEKGSKSRVIGSSVRRDLSEANARDDSKKARDLYTGLMDPTDTRFIELDPAVRQSLADKALTLSEQIDRAVVAKDRANDAQAEKDRKRKHVTNEASMLTSIARSRAGESGSGQTAPSEPPPTLESVIEAFANDEINRQGFDNVMSALTGDDAISDNPVVLTDILTGLNTAKTPAEIDTVLERASKKIGIKGGLTLNTYQGLANQAQQFKDKTPHAVASKRYATALQTAIGESAQRTLTGKDANPARDRRAAEALVFYNSRVNDPINPVPPRIAYKETLLNWEQAKTDDLITTAPSQTVINGWNNSAIGQATPLPLDVGSWTSKEFAQARSVVEILPSRKQDPANGLTPVEKAIETEKLDVLEDNYIFQKKMQERLRQENSNNETPDNQETDEQNLSWMDRLGQTLFGNDEETVDDIRSAN